MTAIAAVLAISAHPSLAQDTAQPTTLDTVVQTPDPAAPDPLAPATTTTETAPADAAPTVAKAAPAKAATRTTRTARTTRTTTTRPPARALSVAPAAPQTSAPAVAIAEAPAVAPIAVQPQAAPMPTPAAPPATQPVAGNQSPLNNDTLPIAGAAGLGLLALAGAGIALRRRRRRRDEDELVEQDAQWDEPAAEPAMPEAAVEPAFVRTAVPLHDPVPARAMAPEAAAASATILPNGFDISRFGPHVQAAYRGPTPDNPSLSLKNRLRRASFFDQRDRQDEVESTTVAPASEPAPTTLTHRDAAFMLGRESSGSPNKDRAFQS
ncbi:MAG: hypothetical protein H0W65_07710 [Sphingomonas sp.]|nr:hypothetical protein [Sphingomonas sp.]